MRSLPSPAVLAAFGAALLLAAEAPADPPAPAPRATRPPARKPPEPLPEPALRVRVVAPSAKGPWTLHLENEGTQGLRVPADIRLLRFTVESGDTMTKHAAKPVVCALPPAMRPDAVQDRNALLLGPGDSYTEAFDPRLFCFGKAASALEGGVLVRATYGWESPARGAKAGPPFVVEGTAFPAAVEPKRQLVAPAMVLSFRPPEPVDDETDDRAAEPAGGKDAPKAEADPSEKDPAGVVDENAPRLALHVTPHMEAATGSHVAVTVTVTNEGHRPAVAAIRGRALGFRIEGPDGVAHCHAGAPTGALPREAFQTLKPGAAVSLTVLVDEACGRDLFRRPGLYRMAPALHLEESGHALGLTAITGVLHAAEPTLVRVAEGPEPFYAHHPVAVRAAPPEPEP